MVTFAPIPPNFYGRTKAANTSSVTGIQGGSNSLNGTGSSTANKTRSNVTPGASNNINNPAQPNFVPPVNFAASVGTSGIAIGTSFNVGGVNLSGAIGYSTTGGFNAALLNPSMNRLAISGLPQAGVYTLGIDSTASEPAPSLDQVAAFSDSAEDRVIISDQTGLFISKGGNFQALLDTGGVLFPYTPVISIAHKANYELENLIQTNYPTPYYINSSVDSINIQGRFTAQTEPEALYILAMMTFFRTATKMFYGASQNRGTPPPVLFLDGYGKNVLDHIPIVISNFSYNLPNDANYISVNYYGKINKVPVDLQITIDAIPTYSRNQISNNFDLVKFSNGQLLTGGFGQRAGGWI